MSEMTIRTAGGLGTKAAHRAGRARSFLAAIWREWQLRRDRRLLQSLDERALADLGIRHSEIDAVVRHGRGQVSSVADARWSLWRSASHG